MNDNEFKLKATLKKGTSQKGNEYTFLELAFDNGYKKKVFLDQAELTLLEMSLKDSSPFPPLKK